MSVDRSQGGRILPLLGLVLISPVLALYGLWLAGGRLADLIERRRMRRGLRR